MNALVKAGRLLLVLVVVGFFVGMPVSIFHPMLGLWLCAPAVVLVVLGTLVIVAAFLGEGIHWAWTGTSWLYADESEAPLAEMRQWCDDISESADVMRAEMGQAWLVGPNIGGLNLDYVRGKRPMPWRNADSSALDRRVAGA